MSHDGLLSQMFGDMQGAAICMIDLFVTTPIG